MTEIKPWRDRVTMIDGKPDTYSWHDAVTQMEAEIDELRAALAQQQDNPELDGSDWSHPAWWRGHDHTTTMFCKKVNDILDGKDDGAGVGNPPWETLRRRLIAQAAPREPMTPEQVEEGFCNEPMQTQVLTAYEVWITAVRWAEEKHGIKEKSE